MCPSGNVSPRPRGLGHGGCDAGLLVLGEDVDAALVALLVGPLRGQEGVDDREGLLERVHAAADADELRVVVLTRELRGLDAPRERAAGAGHLVRGDLLTVAAAAEDEAEAARVGDDAASRLDAEGRVVVDGVVDVRTAVDGLVAVRGEVFDDLVLAFEAGVVGTQVYAHGLNSDRPRRRGAPRGRRDGCRVWPMTSVELGVLGAGALELEEVRVRRQRDGPVPDSAGVLAARDSGQDGAEEGGAVDVDGRGPTSSPTLSMPAWWLRRSSASYSSVSAAAASSAGRPSSARASTTTFVRS